MNYFLSLLIVVFFNFSTLSAQYVTLSDEPKVTLSSGTVKGKSVDFRGAKVYQFLNIPYAEPPIAELRFKKPIAKKPWIEELAVDEWGPHCIQPDFPGFNTGYRFSEDCLGLNVFVSSSGFEKGSRPVMVWIHGGGFGFGSANTPEHYDGTALVGLKDVILVSINYRLGPFGFLHLPEAGVPGNMGLWDQNLALKWVRDNIAKFGGDPNQVTIFGESAGSVSVSAHIVSPQSKGLFKNAIMQSASLLHLDRWFNPDISDIFLEKIKCPSTKQKSCLSSHKPGQYPEADQLFFWPIVGDEFLPDHPEALLSSKGVDPGVNVLLGIVGNEGAIIYMIQDPVTFHPINPVNMTMDHARHTLEQTFGEKTVEFYAERYLANLSPNDTDSIRLAVTNAFGDTMITCPTYIFGRELVNNGLLNVFAYYQTQKPSSVNLLSHEKNSKWMPASHCDDIPMIFGHPFLYPDKHNVDDALLSSIMMDIWTTFARTGKPPSVGQQEWTPWTNNTQFLRPTMVLDSNKLGLIDSTPVDICFNNWPFPLQIRYARTDGYKAHQATTDGHDEF